MESQVCLMVYASWKKVVIATRLGKPYVPTRMFSPATRIDSSLSPGKHPLDVILLILL